MVVTYEYNEMSFSQICIYMVKGVDYVSLANYLKSRVFSGLWQNKNLERFQSQKSMHYIADVERGREWNASCLRD